MKCGLIIFIFLIALWLSLVMGDEGYYSIIAPGTLKSNRKYSVVLTLHDATEPATIRCGIVGPSYNHNEEVVLQPFASQQLDFMPAKLKPGNYLFFAEGLSGLSFRNETMLLLEENAGPHIYVQTDKAVYKPLDLVQFRVLILDEHTRPVNVTEPIRVEIMDANENRVKQFKDILLVQGVFTNKFNLSEHPALGVWQILVTITGKYSYSQMSSFKVKKYVLPKFYVTIENANHVTPENPIVKLKFYGKYNFGKYVEGNATIRATDWRGDPIIADQQLDVSGVEAFDIEVKNFEIYRNLNGVAVTVRLTEKYTQRTQSATSYFNIQQQQYNIIADPNDIEIKDGKPVRLKVKVQQWNGTAVRDRNEPVYMIHGERTYKSQLDDKGEAMFEFEHESEAKHIFKYRDSSAILPNIYSAGDDSKTKEEFFCKLTLLNGRPKLGKIIEINVSSTKNIPYIVYTVTGHGNIIRTELIKLPANQKSYTIQLMSSIEMIPYAHIYVHYVYGGNYRYEEMVLDFPREFENQITLSAPKEAKPGQNVTISIKAQPNSYVGLLAVDLGVYLLDSSYDLDGRQILNELGSDLTYSPIKSLLYPGIISGLLTLTNAHYPFSMVIEHHNPVSWGKFPGDLRSKFPETWIFENLDIKNENTQLTLEIPDTITTWRITAFSIHNNTGLGIVKEATNIVTFKPFFLDIILPYAVKKGEMITLPVTVFNYHNTSLSAEVTLYKNGDEEDFEFSSGNKQQETKNIELPADGIGVVEFTIKPQSLGNLKLNISATASGDLFSDAVLQHLRVEPEGTGNYQNQVMILKVSGKDNEFSSSLSIKVPSNIVTNSEFITLSMGGDSLGPTLENLNNLVMKPTGCGEQNMVNFAPNILVLQYLKTIGKYGQEKMLVKQAKSFVEIGYQQELSFRHASGGFSVFGENQDKGVASTWLTAYVVRFLIKAASFVSVEEKVIRSGLDYLAGNQQPAGDFAYTGYLFYPAQQNRFGFTAFVLMTFMENKKYSKKYKNIIEKGLQFLNGNVDKDHDVYALSIMAAAFGMAKHENSTKVLDKLLAKALTKDKLRWWSANDKNGEKDVEITAYALLALLEISSGDDHSAIFEWLMQERNSKGGFQSTHDTVVGLQAIVKYSQINSASNNQQINLRYAALDDKGREMKTDEFTINGENNLILQTHKLPRSTRSINFKATGNGQSMLQLSSLYYITEETGLKHFDIKPKAHRVNVLELNVEICFTYLTPSSKMATKKNDDDNGPHFSNMVIMKLNLPSGYRTGAELSTSLLENELIQRTEPKNSQTTLIIYFDNLQAGDENCITVPADKTHDVIDRKPAAIEMYDYYNASRSNTVFYTIE
ncbi:thioester-containing protein 1 allele R1 [Musca domestica]|uniref:Thioester-containing protein 1 allele R1 n=1 Tax=Musca domestica TaxID=7370 RepID=A0A9J7I1S3_MUSDO|nr:thioester-containing protein 1 allele R1 [Musca domestica]